MRELVLSRPGQPPTLRESTQELAVGDGDAAVKVLAAAINPHDVRLAAAAGPDGLPLRLGLEAVVEHDGARFYANRPVAPYGTIADRTVVATGGLIRLSTDLDPVDALTAGIPGLAAWFALDKAGLASGDSVLVLGATGAVGQVAVQLALLHGAGHVLAVGRRPDALARLRDRGVTSVVRLDGADDDAARFADHLPGGHADIVIDTLFGPPLVGALRVLRPGGRSVTVGASAGGLLELPSSLLMGRSLLSHRNSDTTVEQKAAAFDVMVEHLRAGRLAVDTASYPLDDAVSAWTERTLGSGNRVVVVP